VNETGKVSIRVSDRDRFNHGGAAERAEIDLRRHFAHKLAENFPLDGTPVMVRATREEHEEPWDRTRMISIQYELRPAQTMNHVVWEPHPSQLGVHIPVADSIGPFLQAIAQEARQLAQGIQTNAYDRDKADKLQQRVQEYQKVIGQATEQLDAAIAMANVAAGAAAALRDEEIFGDIT
jgi:hypothetical protein